MSDGHDSGGGLRWLLTYADMITLLMAFFIMMYSMSVLNVDKFQQAAASLRSQFGPKKSEAASPGGKAHFQRASIAPMGEASLEDDLQSVKDQLEEYIKENQLEDLIRTSSQTRGLVITLVSDNLLFPVGEASLRAPALSILDRIAKLLGTIPNPVEIEGHTCNLPISTAQYPSNWELSAARACTVARYLAEQWHIEPRRLAATGYADSRPVVPNTTEDGRARNRRVEVVILATAPPAEGAPDVGKGTDGGAAPPPLAESHGRPTTTAAAGDGEG
jgi:chemotaxis protein MotB